MIQCIVLICGPPACLKSTLMKILRLICNQQQTLNLQYICIKNLCKNINFIENQYKFLSFDDLFIDYENDIIKYELNWKLYRTLIANELEKHILSKQDNLLFDLKYSKQILERLNEKLNLLSQNDILIIEDNFYYSSMRHRYRQIAQRAQIGFTSIHLYSDISISMKRNQQRELSKRVSHNSIENIYAKYEFSNDDLIINTTDRGLTTEHINKIFEYIRQACNQPEHCSSMSIDDEQRRIATEINHQNFIYQSDQRLRKFISNYLKENFMNNEKFQIANEKRHFAEMINNKKQIFLDLIKYKQISLSLNDDIEQLFQQYLNNK